MAEAKDKQEAISGDGGDGDEKCGGGRMASLGDLPSLGTRMVSQRGFTHGTLFINS